ncbi:uncharacterized protein LOC18440718 isoform X1 [Amborella trichopoda]|uniref:F-box domain-containing protein n=1 Tax=Amborella trichopoda TaxID=13333 RepID=W1PYC7_AMBTC|nr:uncharacterized protein LOC18440718 isoform X1 [Amborella trichopoda]XP_011625750.1 uncharacterized protein LOC18440718 isoform X1 [Amborella trichopoda]XP_020527056.1 uncharacterized protein LOC18440718 isoform X1 [Amborella trichopoda]XP_020527057.1 uncharacterized protein LOC18440718 isoform X1 [Amborella trichopoda]XP_020527058.1 uncharacterized protein LOC18440718 isoform X1 [Amborella trichopoda]ERN12500.1 hypothetical protein AMTR_s00025p00178360 [Amborella trichopoda]|eukprot:XP_006850919.1 uncharacterized protein LOC18440718 isoform X1 [Amborella trichopoda]
MNTVDISIGQEMVESHEIEKMMESSFDMLPDQLLIEIFIRLPISEWAVISCVKKQWANLFRGECLWQTALVRTWPLAGQGKRWPGPIPRGLSKRRYAALYVSKHFFAFDDGIDELAGHTYLFLKEQLELSTAPPSGILHGTIIDQFIACGKSREKAHELASQVWLAVINNLEENEHTFHLLKQLAQEGEQAFSHFPFAKSQRVRWRIFERLLTDFRDCFNSLEYHDVLASARYRFQPLPSSWLGY